MPKRLNIVSLKGMKRSAPEVVIGDDDSSDSAPVIRGGDVDSSDENGFNNLEHRDGDNQPSQQSLGNGEGADQEYRKDTPENNGDSGAAAPPSKRQKLEVGDCIPVEMFQFSKIMASKISPLEANRRPAAVT